jgi:hypothetical protein
MVLEERCHQQSIKLGIARQLAATPGNKAGKRANPKDAVARDEQAKRLIGEILTGRGLPRDTANAIEAEQAEFSSQPEIPI